MAKGGQVADSEDCADVKTFYVGSPQDADPVNLNVKR